LLQDRVAPAQCAAVLKADAYGLGAAAVGGTLWNEGCRWFFVAQLEEGLRLRCVLPEAEIAVLNGLTPGSEHAYAAGRLLPVLNHLGDIECWRAHCRATGRRLGAVLHVDTGMNRLGLGLDELPRLASNHDLLDGIDLRLIMSHLARADEPDHPMSGEQAERFRAALARLPTTPASLANSSGIFLGAQFHFDLTRPGCALYGINPTPTAANPMEQSVRLDARVLQVREVGAEAPIGYGASYRTKRPSRVATVALGYADGYLRSLSGRGAVYAQGVALPLVGRVSMDLITVDATEAPEGLVSAGRLVEVIGPNRTADDIARDAGTIGYEVLTSLGPRYRRVYLEAGQPPG
jgi:alanine racemase